MTAVAFLAGFFLTAAFFTVAFFLTAAFFVVALVLDRAAERARYVGCGCAGCGRRAFWVVRAGGVFTDLNGKILDASKGNYTMTFAKGKTPPVGAFWSTSMYDAKKLEALRQFRHTLCPRQGSLQR